MPVASYVMMEIYVFYLYILIYVMSKGDPMSHWLEMLSEGFVNSY